MYKTYKDLVYNTRLIVDNKINKLLISPESLLTKVLRRRVVISAFLERKMNLHDAFLKFLPYRFYRNPNVIGSFNKYVNNKIKEVADRNNLDIKPANTLYGYLELIGHLNGVILNDQYRAIDNIKKEHIVIDAGANVGIFSILAGLLAKKVFAFEPAPSTYAVLKDNIREYPNIICSQLALGDKSGVASILINNYSSGANHLTDSEIKSKRPSEFSSIPEKVNEITLDQFVEDNKLSRVDFIKIDTEGYEKQIISGAKLTIKKFRPRLAVSAYHLKDDKIIIPKLIKSIEPAYQWELLKNVEEVFHFWHE